MNLTVSTTGMMRNASANATKYSAMEIVSNSKIFASTGISITQVVRMSANIIAPQR